MQLVAAPGVIESVNRRGGSLYVWPHRARCCGGSIRLETATDPPDRVFRRVGADGFDLYVTVGMALPDSLHLEAGRRGRIRAFWNGLAWVA